MAYVLSNSNGTARELCWQRRYSNTSAWDRETCISYCNTGQFNDNLIHNMVATTWDPVVGRFVIAYACGDTGINLMVLPPYNCTNKLTCFATTTHIPQTRVSETPAIACSNQTSPLYANCRVVYARRNVPGQPIAWRQFGLIGSPASITYGAEQSTTIETEHAPAIAWFKTSFYMVVSNWGQLITLHSMTPGSNWVQAGTLNTSGWVSPPSISTAGSCPSCTQYLSVFWLRYAVPPMVQLPPGDFTP
jgi:hypothetical protein